MSQKKIHQLGHRDLKRDVLKSGDARICIPQLGFESGYGTLGAVYTTVEGLLQQVTHSLATLFFRYFALRMNGLLQLLKPCSCSKRMVSSLLLMKAYREILSQSRFPNECLTACAVGVRRQETTWQRLTSLHSATVLLTISERSS